MAQVFSPRQTPQRGFRGRSRTGRRTALGAPKFATKLATAVLSSTLFVGQNDNFCFGKLSSPVATEEERFSSQVSESEESTSDNNNVQHDDAVKKLKKHNQHHHHHDHPEEFYFGFEHASKPKQTTFHYWARHDPDLAVPFLWSFFF